jgi:hypothetical protein
MSSNTTPYYLTEVNDYYLDILNLPELEKSPDDKYYTIESKYEFRPDLLAHELYGDSGYWYVFILRNMDKLEDPIYDFTTGKEIRLPNPRALRGL